MISSLTKLGLVRSAVIAVLFVPYVAIATSHNSAPLIWAPLPPIYFRSGGASIDAEGRATLARYAELAKDNRQIRLAIDGFADTSGSSGMNQRLSTKRAVAVKDYLQSVGVEPEQMSATGRGERRTLLDLSESRRVDVGIWLIGTASFNDVPFENEHTVRLVVHLPDDEPRSMRVRIVVPGQEPPRVIADVTLTSEDPRVLHPRRILDVADLRLLLNAPYTGAARVEVGVTPPGDFWPVVGLVNGKEGVTKRFLPK